MSRTLYDLLGVGPAALLSELRTSYKRRMLEVHPDKGGNVELCQRVVAAFELLADPAARQLYDARLDKLAASQSKRMSGSSPHVARGAQAGGRGSPPGPVQPDNVSCTTNRARCDDAHVRAAAPRAKKTRVSASHGVSEASAPSDVGLDSSSAHGGVPSRGGCGRSRFVTPTPKICRIVVRVVHLLRLLPRDARRDFIERRLSEAQRQAIENFMLSEAKNGSGFSDVIGDHVKRDSETHASGASSDESLGSEDDLSDSQEDEEELLALSDEAYFCAGPVNSHYCPEQSYRLMEDEHVPTWDDKEEGQKRDEEEKRQHKNEEESRSESEEESKLCEPGFAHHRLALNWLKTWEETVQDIEKEEGEKVETEDIAMDVKDCEDKKKLEEEDQDEEEDDYQEDGKNGDEAPVVDRGSRRVGLAARISGINQARLHGRSYYTAYTGFEWLNFRARQRRTLGRALDDHILLVAIRARVPVLSGDSQGELTTPPRRFEEQLRCAISEVLEQSSVVSSDFSLYIYVRLPAYYWVGRCLSSPSYSLGSLGTALNVWRSFREARGHLGGSGSGLFLRCSPAEAMLTWERVREVYLAAWAQRGVDVRPIREKLNALEVANTERRRRQVERWEKVCMEREERLQRAMVRAAFLANAQARREEKREEKRERIAMRQEDECFQSRRLSTRTIERLGHLVSLWIRDLEKIQRRKATLHARDLRRSARARRREEQNRLNALRIQRDERWRWFKRKDLTMEEILRGWRSDQ